jgi:hypothetical protein
LNVTAPLHAGVDPGKLKRVVARQVFKLLDRYDHPAVGLLGIA